MAASGSQADLWLLPQPPLVRARDSSLTCVANVGHVELAILGLVASQEQALPQADVPYLPRLQVDGRLSLPRTGGVLLGPVRFIQRPICDRREPRGHSWRGCPGEHSLRAAHSGRRPAQRGQAGYQAQGQRSAVWEAEVGPRKEARGASESKPPTLVSGLVCSPRPVPS